MSDLLASLAPLCLYVALGVLLRRSRFAGEEQGAFLLKLVVFVTLPVLIAMSLLAVDLARVPFQLPLLGMAANAGCLALAWLWLRHRALPDAVKGTVLVSASILNNLFMFPIILARFGETGFANAVLFDLGNALMVSTITYLTACRFGGQAATLAEMVAKLVRTPLFWSIIGGILVNCGVIPLAQFLRQFLVSLGNLTTPLTLIALGMMLKPRVLRNALLIPILTLRMGAGMALGGVLAGLCGLRGQEWLVVTLCSGAPVGFVSVSLASVAGLDAQLAASAISASVLVGLILMPLWIVLAETLL